MTKTTNISEKRKCKYYDKGYCKYKDQCRYYHPINDCYECDNTISCRNRHRNICKYGDMCFFNQKNGCEYKHENKETEVRAELHNIPLSNIDNQQIETHKVILAATSPSPMINQIKLDHKAEIKQFKEEMKQNKTELEQLKQEIETYKNDTENLRNETEKINKEKETKYKKEIEELKSKNIFINSYKCEIEHLKRVIEEKKNEIIEKETGYKKVIDDLKNKIKMANFEKAYKSDIGKEDDDNKMETESEQKIFTCNGCEFKSIWETYYKEHKKKCRKTKKPKK